MEQPTEFSALLQGAIAMHELFMTHIEVGFTREEALKITIAIMVQSVKNNDSDN